MQMHYKYLIELMQHTGNLQQTNSFPQSKLPSSAGEVPTGGQVELWESDMQSELGKERQFNIEEIESLEGKSASERHPAHIEEDSDKSSAFVLVREPSEPDQYELVELNSEVLCDQICVQYHSDHQQPTDSHLLSPRQPQPHHEVQAPHLESNQVTSIQEEKVCRTPQLGEIGKENSIITPEETPKTEDGVAQISLNSSSQTSILANQARPGEKQTSAVMESRDTDMGIPEALPSKHLVVGLLCVLIILIVIGLWLGEWISVLQKYHQLIVLGMFGTVLLWLILLEKSLARKSKVQTEKEESKSQAKQKA